MRQFFLRDYIKNAIRLFFLGIIIGIVFVILNKGKLQTNIYLLNEEWILYMQTSQINEKSMFAYVLLKRLKELGMMVLLSTTIAGLICLYGLVIFYGAGLGVLLAVSSFRYGVKGLMLVFAASFPQMLVYLPVFLYIFHLCYLLCIKLYFPHKDYWKTGSSMKFFMVKNIICVSISLVVVRIGILLESYVNPKIFFSFLKNF